MKMVKYILYPIAMLFALRNAAEEIAADIEFLPRNEEDSTQSDDVFSHENLRKALEQGNLYERFDLSKMWHSHSCSSFCDAEAVKWFIKEADQGNADAQYILGLFYDKGYGVNKDIVKAGKLYYKAAEQGHVRAQEKLGYISVS